MGMPHIDLLELPYFEGISIDAVVSLVDLMEPVHFASQAIIMQEGDATPPHLYIATGGRVIVSKRNEHNISRDLAELDSPTLVGEVELFCQIPPVSTIRAATAVSAFAFTRPTFDRLFAAQHPALMLFTFNVARVVSHRLAVSDEMLAGTLASEDLVKVRRAVFARMTDREWPLTTGAFRRPDRTELV